MMNPYDAILIALLALAFMILVLAALLATLHRKAMRELEDRQRFNLTAEDVARLQ